MKKMINKSMIEGTLIEKDLRSGTTKANVPYIAGRLHIETAPGNVVTVEVFEQQKTSKGAENQKFPTLKGLWEKGQATHDGSETPTKLRIASSLEINDWVDRDGVLRSNLVNDGGYVNVVSTLNPKAEFEVDVVISKVSPEVIQGNTTDRAVIDGYVFNYRGVALPVKFIVENQKGVKFFSSLQPNTFTRVWGVQVNNTIVNEKTEESAFGDSKVVKSSYTRKEFVVTGAQTIPYDEDQLTDEELKAAIQARNVAVAEKKTAKAPASTPTPQSTTTKPKIGSFNF
jgi:hypothetical protein